jgi:hypothetical protein
MNQPTAAAPSPPADLGVLPPYSGRETTCIKCSHTEADTQHKPPVRRGAWDYDGSGQLQIGPLPERLERRCENCGFTWNEALCPPTAPPPGTCEVPHATDAEEDECERRRAPQPEKTPTGSEATG